MILETNASGIYEITCGNSRYIGSAVNIRARWHHHRTPLRKGKHKNRNLQSLWDEKGEDAFTFSVLTNCRKEDLIAFEQLFLDTLFWDLNIVPQAGNHLGAKRTAETRAKIGAISKARKQSWEEIELRRSKLFGRPVSLETRAKLAMQKGWTHSEEAKAKMRGRKVSDETRQKLRDAYYRNPPRSKEQLAETGSKISARLTGREMPEETRNKIRETHRMRAGRDGW